MRTRFTVSVCASLALIAAATATASAQTYQLGHAGAAGASHLRLGPARTEVLPLRGVSDAQLRAAIQANATVTAWSSSIVSPLDHHTYTYRMVGKNPFVHQSTQTAVPTDVIPVSVTFTDTGFVFDPTAPDPGCLPGSSTADGLTLASPIFKPHTYVVGGTNIGTVQYVDGFQRENFAKEVFSPGAPNPGYHVSLTAINHAKYNLTVNPSAGGTVFSGCSGIGEIDINQLDPFIKSTVLPAVHASPTHLPLLLFYNVVLTNGVGGSCCILGYHSAKNTTGGIQTYSISDYDSSGAFTGTSDVSIMSHEVGEWMDDPFVNNATPAWGHIGQVSGCQGNLEVGDPLSGTIKPVAMPNGVTYHGQELAFRDWFYRTPSIGLHGWFSNFGKFTKSAGPVCH